MVSPTTKEQRMSIWDSFRRRFNIDVERVSSRDKLEELVRKEGGLDKYERAKGRTKSTLSLIRKTDFWQKSKYEDRLEFIQHKRDWKEGEEGILRRLVGHGFKGRELVDEFNARVKPNRSYMAIMVKKSRLGL